MLYELLPFVVLKLQINHLLEALTESFAVNGKSNGLCNCRAKIASFIAACNLCRNVEYRKKAVSSLTTACKPVSSPCVVQS